MLVTGIFSFATKFFSTLLKTKKRHHFRKNYFVVWMCLQFDRDLNFCRMLKALHSTFFPRALLLLFSSTGIYAQLIYLCSFYKTRATSHDAIAKKKVTLECYGLPKKGFWLKDFTTKRHNTGF